MFKEGSCGKKKAQPITVLWPATFMATHVLHSRSGCRAQDSSAPIMCKLTRWYAAGHQLGSMSPSVCVATAKHHPLAWLDSDPRSIAMGMTMPREAKAVLLPVSTTTHKIEV
jgi:hypothetical protein